MRPTSDMQTLFTSCLDHKDKHWMLTVQMKWERLRLLTFIIKMPLPRSFLC